MAVTTATRSSLEHLKDLPTVPEAMVSGFQHSLWQAVFAPPSWDAALVNALDHRPWCRCGSRVKSIFTCVSIRQAGCHEPGKAISPCPWMNSNSLSRISVASRPGGGSGRLSKSSGGTPGSVQAVGSPSAWRHLPAEPGHARHSWPKTGEFQHQVTIHSAVDLNRPGAVQS